LTWCFGEPKASIFELNSEDVATSQSCWWDQIVARMRGDEVMRQSVGKREGVGLSFDRNNASKRNNVSKDLLFISILIYLSRTFSSRKDEKYSAKPPFANYNHEPLIHERK